MKKTFLMASALLALSAGVAAAGGINLSWTNCGVNGVEQRNFACTSNSGASIMFGSVIAPVEMPQLNGQASVLDLQTNQPTLSDWWQLAAGGCRAGSIGSDFNFSTLFDCINPWGTSGGVGTLGYNPGYGGPNKARINIACARPGSFAMDDVSETYMFKITLLYSKSNGLGRCVGCSDGACIVFNSILLTQPLGVGNYTVSNPIERQHILWQAGAGTVAGGCPQATPTRNATWGSVKSLYR